MPRLNSLGYPIFYNRLIPIFTFSDQEGSSGYHNTIILPLYAYTFKVNDVVDVASQVSTMVEANIPVVTERAMFLPQGSSTDWKAGNIIVG